MKVRVALAQLNTTVGDVQGNADKVIQYIDMAGEKGVSLIAFPEQTISGYPAEDLLFKPQFLKANREALDQVAARTEGICAIVGFPEANDKVYNSAAICADGGILDIYRKTHLPNYGVFDEVRYFTPGNVPMVVSLGEYNFGITVCEDIWVPGTPETEEVLAGDAQCIINISASPFHAGKARSRARMMAERAVALKSYVCFVNLVGGQDELVFDGNSAVFDHNGDVAAHALAFEEDLLIADLNIGKVLTDRLDDSRFLTKNQKERRKTETIKLFKAGFDPCAGKEKKVKTEPRIESAVIGIEEIYKALMLGCRDYIRKNGFSKVVLGLSGGVDSAISATVAADALGPENVITLFMPGKYTSDESRQDAFGLAENLGIQCITVPISDVFDAYINTLESQFKGKPQDTTEENIQARIRGNYLMAFSNKFGYLVLTTGNKSENSVGYATLYGDMAGGFNIIKDVPKVMIYELCRYRNKQGEKPVIPENILVKAPTAELRPDQKDSDSLPEYDVLDPILKMYVELDYSFDKIVEQGFDPEMVARVIRLVDTNEYKRRQASPGIRITPRAFGKDRRLPITNRYKDGKTN